jgi:uridine phosphorylase
LGPVAILVSASADVNLGLQAGAVSAHRPRRLFTSRLYGGPGKTCLVGPLIGAPYAVMLLENLVAWGARAIVFAGWCGSLTPAADIGALVLPTAAFVDEGTSRHYGASAGETVHPPGRTTAALRQAFDRRRLAVHPGPVWTTDAPYRETPAKVAEYSNRGALAVEMEFSALCTAGKFLNVAVGGALVVSDTLFGGHWRPGFRDERFKLGRKALFEGIRCLCRNLPPP